MKLNIYTNVRMRVFKLRIIRIQNIHLITALKYYSVQWFSCKISDYILKRILNLQKYLLLVTFLSYYSNHSAMKFNT